MAEAQPHKGRGGHAYGRRVKQLSNTAEEGELCLYSGHSLGRFSCLLYTSPSPRDATLSRMPSSA